MCGIAGIWLPARQQGDERLAQRLISTLSHRGPDASGYWNDRDTGVQLAHARLSILDLSAAGAQPMHASNGRYVIVFNGEIYNHTDIRSELESRGQAPRWCGTSDTETLIEAILAWGLQATLDRAVGMFAFALYDRRDQTLTLVRDRFGEKPLYWGWADDGAFLFASELKAFREYPAFSGEIDAGAVEEMLGYGYICAPRSIYRNAHKLRPAGQLVLTRATFAIRAPKESLYWSLDQVAAAARADRFTEHEEALHALDGALRRAVSEQSIADVPVGAFLSGGIDSSLIVSLMQAQSSRQVETFTIGFEDSGFDESPHAQAVADHLGTNHHTIPVTAEDALALIPRLPRIFDEPFADRSQIPTYFVAQAARSKVTVALTGDAGDELFCGYTHYFWGDANWRHFARLPHAARKAAGKVIATLAGNSMTHPERRRIQRMAARLQRVRSDADLFDSISTEWYAEPAPVAQPGGHPVRPHLPLPEGLSQRRAFMAMDQRQYLPDDILTKVDRVAMASSLETRVPFLDHRVAEIALRLPDDLLVSGTTGKVALRRLLDRHVPRALIDRPKAGFGVPVGAWLRGPLKAWANDLLDPVEMEQDGHLDATRVRQIWAQHRDGRCDWSQPIWSILMFQAWKETVRSSPRAVPA